LTLNISETVRDTQLQERALLKSAIDWLSEIFSDIKHRAVSTRVALFVPRSSHCNWQQSPWCYSQRRNSTWSTFSEDISPVRERIRFTDVSG